MTSPECASNDVKQPITTVFSERPADADVKLKQPITTIFGEGNTTGSPDNHPTKVVLGPDGKPTDVKLNHSVGYTECPDLTVVRQPITTRFGAPIKGPEAPGTQKKYAGFPTRPLFQKRKRQTDGKPFIDV